MKNIEKFKIIQGRKSPDDKILLFNNVAVAFEDVSAMICFFMDNEDTLYPPSRGFKGAEYFKEYIRETLDTRRIPSGKKYQTNKGLTKV
jgi:hypothetical protein